MKARDLVQKGNTLEVWLKVTYSNDMKYEELYSPEYVFCGSTVFQMKVIIGYRIVLLGQQSYKNLIFIKFVKSHPDDNLIYTIDYTSKRLLISNKCYTSDDGRWHQMAEHNGYTDFEFDVKVQVNVVFGPSCFSPLYEDTELLDFELQGVDGSVHFHKHVLAASSPVLRKMLGGAWRETTEGRVDVSGTSTKTLQHLKNYMYLHVLPDEDVEQLLLLSLYYMMPILEQRCVHRLKEILTEQNTCDLLKFAANHEATRLLLGILECVQNVEVDVKGIRDRVLHGESVTIANGEEAANN